MMSEPDSGKYPTPEGEEDPVIGEVTGLKVDIERTIQQSLTGSAKLWQIDHTKADILLVATSDFANLDHG